MDRFNLGSYRRRISTVAAETQRWFDIGLNWCYGFNHEEGIKCFERALETDATCPMVHWGIAYAAGPFYNLTWKEHGPAEVLRATQRCFEHMRIAKAHAWHAKIDAEEPSEVHAARAQKELLCHHFSNDIWGAKNDGQRSAARRRIKLGRWTWEARHAHDLSNF